MQAQILINGQVTLVLSCDNVMEEEAIKQLLKQDNTIDEIRTNTVILSKTYQSGLIISKDPKKYETKTKVVQPVLKDNENLEKLSREEVL